MHKTAYELLEENGWNSEQMDWLFFNGFGFRGHTLRVNGKRITAEDVIYYYAHDARNITSGCRQLGSIRGDWRPIDRLAKTCLAIYKVLKRDQLVREAKKYVVDSIARRDKIEELFSVDDKKVFE